MNHLLRIGRYIFKPDWTISHLHINGVSTYYGVEDEIRAVKVKGETAVDYGIYKLGIRYSPKFSKEYYYSEIKNKLAIAQMKILVFKMIITKDIITKEQIVKINKIAKKKKSSAGPTSF